MSHTLTHSATMPFTTMASSSHMNPQTLTDLRPHNVSDPSSGGGTEDHEHSAMDGHAALRSRHSRTRSATASTTPVNLCTTTLRARASSTTEHSSTANRPSPMRTVSFSHSLLPPVAPVLSLATETEETIGSFSPTSCPRQHLHHLLGGARHARPRFHSLRVVPSLRLKLPFDLDLAAANKHRSTSGSDSDSDVSIATSPISPIPSICRTPSTYSESEYFSTAPSSAGPVTPIHSRSSSPKMNHKSLRPILEALEDASRFRVRTSCASCHKLGSNFPCCPRCGEMWCSRECRVRSTGGKRHVCGSKVAVATPMSSRAASAIEVSH